MGEGLTYEALCKDLRPSLDWTPEYGWMVPIPLVAFRTPAFFIVFVIQVFPISTI